MSLELTHKVIGKIITEEHWDLGGHIPESADIYLRNGVMSSRYTFFNKSGTLALEYYPEVDPARNIIYYKQVEGMYSQLLAVSEEDFIKYGSKALLFEVLI